MNEVVSSGKQFLVSVLECTANFVKPLYNLKKGDKYFVLGLVTLGLAVLVIPFVSSVFAPMIAFVSVAGFLVSGFIKWNSEA